jgi:hypothetical protein
MSLYIHPENQRVLWTTINKARGFAEKQDSDEWFKQTIAHFYHQNSTRVLNRNDLLQLNKETIEYMIQQLKSINVPVIALVPSSITALAPSPIASSITSHITSSITTLDADTKMSPDEINARLTFRSLQDQIDELREEIRALRKPT